MNTPPTQAEVLVLLSGGVDSAACVDFYTSLGRPACGLFVDYGQPAAPHEAVAARRVATHYGIRLYEARWEGSQPKGPGLIPGRNMFLVAAALVERPASVSVIALGIHAGTSYDDCTPGFVDSVNALLRAADTRTSQLAAPFVNWSKGEILTYCDERGVPIEFTYSCEAGGSAPCGQCLSCRDRQCSDACA